MLRFSCQSKNGLDENYKFCSDVEIVCIVYVYCEYCKRVSCICVYMYDILIYYVLYTEK